MLAPAGFVWLGGSVLGSIGIVFAILGYIVLRVILKILLEGAFTVGAGIPDRLCLINSLGVELLRICVC